MSDTTRQRRQVELAEQLQEALLRDFDRLLTSGEMSPTDRATLARLLSNNGWSLDPSKLPAGIRSKLTAEVDPADLEDEVEGVIRFPGAAA